jgi:hypothetical protein
LGGKFLSLGDKNKWGLKILHIVFLFLEKNDRKLPYFKGKKFEIVRFRLWILGSSMSQKYSMVQKIILLSCLIYSQIWLRPLVDGRQSTNFTKLKKKKKNPNHIVN